jgi:hypothetical protein
MGDLFPEQNSLFNPPQPGGSLIDSGNPMLDLLITQYLPQMLGVKPDEFLPQLMPGQHIFDQMASYKYNASRMRNEGMARSGMGGAARNDDQGMLRTLTNIRNNLFDTPMSGTERSQLQFGAEMLNSQPGEMLMNALMGPQNAEDFFFGTRGSKVRLARAVNQIGFSRRDSVTGKKSMSAESLETFTDQIFNNLYGEDADLDDIAGFSAGRTGDLMTGLARRGLLPQSAVNMNPAERRRVFKDKRLRPVGDSDFTPEVERKLDAGESVEELAKTAEGASAVRKIDAKRVSNTLKEYTGALSAVREIFGDNGMSNAPMGQLMAAMDALTQNTMSSQSPAKLEQTLRRMQLSSRDSGIGMEALVGLTGRSGALADKYGLSREIAQENVIGAMDRSKALNDTGGFSRPGFNRVDPTKAAMFMLDQGMRADSSGVGRMIAVANRVVEENKGDAGFQKNGRNLMKMVDAMKRGATTYFDDERNEQVDIYKEMGTEPGKFFDSYFKRAGVTDARVGAYYRDQNTQEFMIAGRAVYAQSAELKQQITGNFMSNTGVKDAVDRATVVPAAERAALNRKVSENLSATLVDDVNTTMTADQRLDAMQGAMKTAAVEHIRSTTKNLKDDEVDKRANALLTGPGGMFKDDKDMREFLATQQGRAGIFVQARTGMSMGLMQQIFNKYAMAESSEVQQANIARAELFSDSTLGGGSNILQRLSESGGDPFAAMGKIKAPAMRKHLIRAISGSNDPAAMAEAEKTLNNVYSGAREVISDNTVSVDTVVKDLKDGASLDGLINDDRVLAASTKEKMRGKTYKSTAAVAEELKAAYNDPKNKKAINDLISNVYSGSKSDIDEAMRTGAAFTDLAARTTTRGLLTKAGVTLGAYSENTYTEAELRRDNPTFFKNSQSREQMRAVGELGKRMEQGKMTAGTIMDVYGTDIKDPTKRTEIMGLLTEALKPSSNEDAYTKLDERLKTAGVDDEQRKIMTDTARYGRGDARSGNGGLNRLGSKENATLIALEEQIDKGIINKDSDIGKILKGADDKAKQDLIKDQPRLQQEYADKTTWSGKPEEIDTDKKQEALEKRVSELQGAEKAATDPTGMVGAIGGAVSTAIEGVLKTALNNVKIENVTIAKVEFSGMDMGKIVSGAVSAIFGSAPKASTTSTAATGKQEITGTLRILDMERAVFESVAQDTTTHVPGGIPVHNIG